MTGMTREQAMLISELVESLRPDWDRRDVYHVLGRVKNREPLRTSLRALHAAADQTAIVADIANYRLPDEDTAEPPEEPLNVPQPGHGYDPSRPGRSPKVQAVYDALAATRNVPYHVPTVRTEQTNESLGEVPDYYRFGGAQRPPRYDANPDDPMVLEPGSISPKQLQAIHIGFAAIGITERDEKLGYCRAVLDHEVASTKDLSQYEASRVITRIREVEALLENEEANRPSPQPEGSVYPDQQQEQDG